MSPVWLTAFIDLPADGYDEGVTFWRSITGYALSEPRGRHAEFATLVPPDGHPFLRVQRIDEGQPGLHLDLHHPAHDFRVLTSPSGFAYCHVSEIPTGGAGPAVWPGGHRSIVNQVCIDIPASRFDEECAFWSERTGWPLVDFSAKPEFRALERPPEQPLRILLQRLDSDQPHATAHFDISTDDLAAEIARHQALGAEVIRELDWWTVLRDPLGTEYCLIERDAESQMLT